MFKSNGITLNALQTVLLRDNWEFLKEKKNTPNRFKYELADKQQVLGQYSNVTHEVSMWSICVMLCD